MSTSGLLIDPCDVYDFCQDDQSLTWAGGHGRREGGESCSHVLLFPKQGPSNGQRVAGPACSAASNHDWVMGRERDRLCGHYSLLMSSGCSPLPLTFHLLPSLGDNGIRMQFLLTLHNQKYLLFCLSHCLVVPLFVCPIPYLLNCLFVPFLICTIVYLSLSLFVPFFICPILYLSHSLFVPFFICPIVCLSHSLFVPFFICPIPYLYHSLFVPFFICPILYLSYSLFVPLFVCPIPYLYHCLFIPFFICPIVLSHCLFVPLFVCPIVCLSHPSSRCMANLDTAVGLTLCNSA